MSSYFTWLISWQMNKVLLKFASTEVMQT